MMGGVALGAVGVWVAGGVASAGIGRPCGGAATKVCSSVSCTRAFWWLSKRGGNGELMDGFFKT